jgi:hypothetical protein
MKTRRKYARRQFQLRLLAYGSHYYVERIMELEKLLAKKPARLQIEMIGEGEIPADIALLIRSVLLGRWPKTELVTYARSSLQNGAVLVWLLGDRRIIRDDARLFFRAAKLPVEDVDDGQWKDKIPRPWNTDSEPEPDEFDLARVLELINEFLPVKELTGQIIGLPVLKQFGLVENEKLDHFLAAALGKSEPVPPEMGKKRVRDVVKVPQK